MSIYSIKIHLFTDFDNLKIWSRSVAYFLDQAVGRPNHAVACACLMQTKELCRGTAGFCIWPVKSLSFVTYTSLSLAVVIEHNTYAVPWCVLVYQVFFRFAVRCACRGHYSLHIANTLFLCFWILKVLLTSVFVKINQWLDSELLHTDCTAEHITLGRFFTVKPSHVSNRKPGAFIHNFDVGSRVY